MSLTPRCNQAIGHAREALYAVMNRAPTHNMPCNEGRRVDALVIGAARGRLSLSLSC